MNLIEIEQLNASFPSKAVLHDINLAIRKGGKTAVVGESGSGKTVLAQGIMQLNPAVSFSGRILFEGRNLLEKTPRRLQQLRGREIGMVFQEPMTALNPVMRVGAQIAEILTLHLGLDKKTAWQKATDLLAKTGIDRPEEKAQAYPFQLSGGQRQRVMIAMAVAAEPKLLIADEPTTALDVAVQAQILDLLSRLQAEKNMALLYITHDLNLVRRFADDVAVMRHGRIVEQGSVAEVFARPRHEYTRMLLDAKPVRDAVCLSEKAETVLQAENMGVSVIMRTAWFKKHEKTLLSPLSFDLKSGETLGVIGESGSGKTTLAKALLRLMPSSGNLKLDGENWRPALRQKIQMVFQDPFGAFNPRMNVLQIVGEALSVYEPGLKAEEKQARVVEMLQTVGLESNILTRYPHEFSGGQRQRLAIARAIIVRPKILVLDEPTSALDVQWQQKIINILKHLQQKYGMSLIIISHDLSVINALSHRVVVLKNGKVAEQGSCETVFAKPENAYTKQLLAHNKA